MSSAGSFPRRNAGSALRGQVLCGINNIYTVSVDGRNLSCRIKGKILRNEHRTYNPIAVGDWVRLSPDPHEDDKGWIESREERSSFLVRYNKKRNAPQIIAANVDVLVCVTSAAEPPFRPRFVDRLLVSAQAGGAAALIFANKCDLGFSVADRERLDAYRAAGYTVVEGSALDGVGIERLLDDLHGKTAVFAGQSGVGKSHLLNSLFPGLDLKVGRVSQKYNRGAHTTSYAVMIEPKQGFFVIDTPGVRELDLYGVSPRELTFYFPEFEEPSGNCAYTPCHHLDEPDCRVREAVRRGAIHEDRYVSYVRIYEALTRFYQENPGYG